MDEDSKSSKLKILFWFFTFIFFLVLFIFVNFPEYKIRAYFESTLENVLNSQRISIQKSDSKLSFFWGLNYTLIEPQFFFPNKPTPLKMDKLNIQISYFPLIFGKISGNTQFNIKNGSGDISFSLPIAKNSSQFSPIELQFDLKNVELTHFNIAQVFMNISLEGVLNLKGFLTMQSEDPTSWESEMDLKIISLRLPSQSINTGQFPLKLPQIQISTLTGQSRISQSKLRVEKLQFGQAEQNTQDDLQGVLSGIVQLSYPFSRSQLDLTTEFKVSPQFIEQIQFIQTILAPGRQSNGSYKYKLAGTIASGIIPQPIK